uniref:C2H2-type domain-containing protein n=1 Tax=Anopheles christyi TaxID=43041 RepID=A0A182JQI8_9DIPT
MDVAPSMVQRSGDKLIVRRVVSGEQVHLSEQQPPVRSDDGESTDQQLLEGWRRFSTDASTLASYDEQLTDGEGTQPGPSSNVAEREHDQQLPQCKIKRNYSCGRCTYFTQNPRKYLTHLRDTHGEKIVINECKRCLYASRHYQKLVRHMKMVHGSVDGIRKSSFGSSRRRVQKNYGQMHLGQVLPAGTSKLSRTEANQLTTAYVQQLVASGLPKLLEEMEKSAAGTALAANFAREGTMIQVDMDQLNQSMPYSSDETVQEASEGDGIDGVPSEATAPVSLKKRSRPIPNLIPLNMSTAPSSSSSAARTTQKFVKPVPLASLKAENGESDRSAEDYPLSLTKHQPMTVSAHREDIMTKCMYCELSFKPVEALANHIKLAHKDDLIASLLANSFEDGTDANKSLPRPSEAARTVNEIWKRLLECSAEAVQTSRKYDGSGSGSAKDPRPESNSTNDETDDDNREEHQSQTFCGVETAPGYGEVTNRLPTIDSAGNVSSGGTGLMKKVFKCPHCSFWASTASRFHVHIVGHLNKKPFECSLCAYRSNWRWDITKHIRLKTIRDPSHKNAGVLMNDETGRRNYTKYNKYIALMQITDK